MVNPLQLPTMPTIPRSDFSWIGDLAGGLVGAVNRRKEDAAFNSLADKIGSSGSQSALAGLQGNAPAQVANPSVNVQTAPITPVIRGQEQGSTYRPFIETVQARGLTNPYGLAAVAATGSRESGWSGNKANATWSDPSESGQAGTSGGILSWRGDRLANLQNYAKSKGEQGNGSPQTQAEFFIAENPQVIQALQNAKSPQEASSIIANAWKFAGYDRPGGEAARRAALTQNYYAQEFGRAPNAGAAAIEAIAPQTPQAGFDNGRFAANTPVAQDDLGLRRGLAAQTNDLQAAPAYRDPVVSAQPEAAPTPLPFTPEQAPAPAPAPQAAPQSNLLAAGVTPIPRGGVDSAMIADLIRNRATREIGLQLWQKNATGQTAGAWDFANLPDGTLVRQNKQTGAVERIGNFAKPDNETAVVGNDLVRKSDGKVIYTGDAKAPQIVELFDEATGQPYKATYNPKTKEYDRVGGVKARSGMSLTTNPDGTVTLTEGTVGNIPKLTESEGRNTGFYGRASESHKLLNNLEKEGTSLLNAASDLVPVVGNYAKSDDAQKYRQAKRDFINAVLRRESGAVISPEEFANADQQYFPQPGDGKLVIDQKRTNRENTIRGLEVSSGQGAKFAVPERQPAQPTQAAPAQQFREGQTATNPSTGERIIFRGGAWQTQ